MASNDDGLDELFRGRRLGAATIASIRGLDLQSKDLVDLSDRGLSDLCQAIRASAGDAFKIKASVGVARQAVTGIQGFGSASEGLSARLYISERRETVAKLENLVSTERAVVVRAPPQSGKTSLLQLLEMSCKSKYTDVFCISLAGINGHDFDYMWCQHYPGIPVARLQSSASALLLVDEGQSGFHALNLTLWALIKAARSGDSSLHIVLVSSFGSDECDTGEGAPTPIVFYPSCAVTIRPQAASESSGVCIQFTDSECMELWQNWCKFCDFKPKNDNILNYVMDVSDRQPGLMTHILDWLVRRKFNDKNRLDCEEFAKSELLSERFMNSLSNIRSISTFRNMCWKREYADLLAKLLNSGSAMGSAKRTELSVDELSAADKLLRKGQLVRTKTMDFMFPSALHRHYYATLSAGTLTVSQVQDLGIEEFLVCIIRRMNSQRLACLKSRSRNDGTLYERQYQNEFYRAYCTLLSVPMSPDVGKLYGVAGYVDFYLATFKWAFEIARDGIRLGEHLDRFALRGRYSALISKGVVLQYVVVNMEAGGVVYEDEPGLIQVVFSEDYTSAMIYPSDQLVFLQG